MHRLVEQDIAHDAPEKRFGESVLPLRDSDGMRLALVAVKGAGQIPGWSNGEIPAEHAIRGFHGVTLMVDAGEQTAQVLTGTFGFTADRREVPLGLFQGARRRAVRDRDRRSRLHPGRAQGDAGQRDQASALVRIPAYGNRGVAAAARLSIGATNRHVIGSPEPRRKILLRHACRALLSVCADERRRNKSS
jgi:hypothetical protein